MPEFVQESFLWFEGEGVRIPRIILGHLPLIGVSYQGKQKDDEYSRRFRDKREMKNVMKAALKRGLDWFAASSHDFNELAPTHLAAVKELENEEGRIISLIPCLGIPLEVRGSKVNDYRRWATYLTYEREKFGKGVRRKYLEDPVLNCRPGWRENLAKAKPYDAKEREEIKIAWNKVEERLNVLSEYHVKFVEPGSESDFLILSRRMDLLLELIDRIYESGFKGVLIGTHHAGASIPLIEEDFSAKFDGYVTPINKLGVMMFPTKQDAKHAIEMTQRLVIAIKPFAGGRIKPEEALKHVYKMANLCMIGVGSVAEAEEDLEIAKRVLNTAFP